MADGAANGILATDPRVGPVLRGQRWVRLDGDFTIDELREIAQAVETHSANMERAKHDGISQ